jgi:hypothetical protein
VPGPGGGMPGEGDRPVGDIGPRRVQASAVSNSTETGCRRACLSWGFVLGAISYSGPASYPRLGGFLVLDPPAGLILTISTREPARRPRIRLHGARFQNYPDHQLVVDASAANASTPKPSPSWTGVPPTAVWTAARDASSTISAAATSSRVTASPWWNYPTPISLTTRTSACTGAALRTWP